MVNFVARSIEKKADIELAQGQELYRKYFIYTAIYKRYKSAVDEKLIADGYEEVIVTE